MNLNDWASLSEPQRDELIAEWQATGQLDEYVDLALCAAEALKRELQYNLDVTNVCLGSNRAISYGKQQTQIHALGLEVCTVLPENRSADKIPANYCGFSVGQLNLREKRDEFLQTLNITMKELKGWSESDTLKWANQRPHESLIDSLTGGFFFTVVYAKGPVKLAASALIDDFKREGLVLSANESSDLYDRIVSIILDAAKKAGAAGFYQSSHPDKLEHFDWKSVRDRINKLIAT